MIKHDRNDDGQATTVALEPPTALERWLAPMWMCCGHWSYGLSLSALGVSATLTWIEDENAACSGVLFRD